MNFKIKTLFIVAGSMIALFIVAMILWTFQLKYHTDHMHDAERKHHHMLKLAAELRQSSDDLTLFARAYVVTGDIQYKKNYMTVLAIRNGEHPRPQNYDQIYWDLSPKLRQLYHPLIQKERLADEMHKLPFSGYELKQLQKAQQNSDALVMLEIEAFHAVEGLFKDTKGLYTVKGKPDKAYAAKLLYSKEYVGAKEQIMLPIDYFLDSLSTRTSRIEKLHQKSESQLFEKIFILLASIVIISVIMVWMIYHKVMYPISALRKNIIAYQKGKTGEEKFRYYHDEIGLMIENFFEMRRKIDKDVEELKKARHEANASNSAKSSFLANMSHEIRTPMNAILGFVNILEKMEEEPEKLKKLTIVKESAHSLMTIIDDILDFSKIESGKLSIEKQQFDLPQLFMTVSELFYERAQEKGVSLKLSIDPDMPHNGCGDTVRIKQVYANLLSNAVKFSPQGSDIESKVYRESNGLAVCEVKDRGVGIAPENLEKIFHAFEQEDDSTTRKFGGTGLGLSISRSLAQMMGGDITVQSRLEEGSTFRFTFDAYSEVKAQMEVTEEKDDHGETNGLPKFEADVLIVEDNRSNQLLLTIMLEEMGIKSFIASDGAEAVKACMSKKFDLILMDENMPNMNGIEATKRIKEADYKNTPIIAVTANALKGDRERFLEAGMDDYITKPIQSEALIAVLKKYL